MSVIVYLALLSMVIAGSALNVWLGLTSFSFGPPQATGRAPGAARLAGAEADAVGVVADAEAAGAALELGLTDAVELSLPLTATPMTIPATARTSTPTRTAAMSRLWLPRCCRRCA